jgi:hypothetical protein
MTDGRLETFTSVVKNESSLSLYVIFLHEIAVFSVYFRGLFYYWPTLLVLPPNGRPLYQYMGSTGIHPSPLPGGQWPLVERGGAR